MNPSSFPPLRSPPASPFPPQPSRRGDGLARRAGSEGQGSLPSVLRVSGFTRPRGRPHLYVFIGDSCLLRVLVMEFEGELCLHHSWRDALGQQRGPVQGLGFAPPPPQSEARPWGDWKLSMEATRPQLQSDSCSMSISCLLPPELPLAALISTIYRALTISQVYVLQNV